jgi:DNA-binding NarL/FixJ family response regulator
VRRVLFGDFGAVLRAGFDDVLRGEEVEVLGTEGNDVVARLVDALPDVVVLDVDDAGTRTLVARLVREFPAVKVVTCSARRPLMRVYPPFHHGESYEATLEPDVFSLVVQT